MKNRFSTEALIKKLKTNAFILNSSMPMGYVPNLPILCILNGNLCMKIPFLKYKVTGEIDKTFVYPTRYVATVLVPEEQVVAFEDLSLQRTFTNVSFSDPIGTFRHDAIKDYDKKAYDNLRSTLYKEYDKIVDSLVNGGNGYSANDEIQFRKLFNTIIEPSLRPFYKAIDKDFAKKYIIE